MICDAIRAGALVTLICVWCVSVLFTADLAAQDAFHGRANGPTFSKDVAPIFYAKCVSCHRPGEVAPMSLITFRDARPWARAIQEKVTTREMPPWHADRQYGTFRNELSLTQQEIDTIASWVAAGAREGDSRELPTLPVFTDGWQIGVREGDSRELPTLPVFTDGWQIGVPDIVFEMPFDFHVPSTGTVDYQYFDVPTNFAEDRWMQAGEARAGDRAHVHHIVVYLREPDRSTRPKVVSVRPILPPGEKPASPTARLIARLSASDATGRPPGGGDAMLVNWAVGEDAPVYLPGMAKRIPAGSTLVFQMHYTTDGEPGVDRSQLGLIFAPEPPEREIRTGLIANPMLALPPGAANHQVEAEATFSENVKVWTLHPHMHLRGKDMTYTVIYPDGRREIVLHVPRFDFGWQTDYWLSEPLALPKGKGSTLHVSAHFDNSAANRDNPDPTATVRWGDQTWEEMMIGFFTYTVEGEAPAQRVSR